MGGGHCHDTVGKLAGDSHGGHEKALCHGRAGTVQTKVGDPAVAQGEGRTNALIQQIPGEHHSNLIFRDAGLFDQGIQGNSLHMLFGLFPGFLSEQGIL